MKQDFVEMKYLLLIWEVVTCVDKMNIHYAWYDGSLMKAPDVFFLALAYSLQIFNVIYAVVHSMFAVSFI